MPFHGILFPSSSKIIISVHHPALMVYVTVSYFINDAVSAILSAVIWRQTYGMNHSDSERANPMPPHVLLFPISSKGSSICNIQQTG